MKSIPVKVLETAKIVLGILIPLSMIWNFEIRFDPGQISTIIDIILAIIGGGTLAVSGARGYLHFERWQKGRYND